MKLARNSRLSLRKLFTAMLAVGPLAVLPSPVWATVPQGTTAPFQVNSGSATWNGSGTTGTITASTDRTILTWGVTTTGNNVTYLGVSDGSSFSNFNIASGETFNFIVPSSSGAILNKVSAGTNTNNPIFNGLGKAAAVINGSLLSNGRVIILSTDGNIILGGGAQISTGGGLVLSAQPDNDFAFNSTGNLGLNSGTNAAGTIYLGTGSPALNVVGNLAAYASNVTANNISVSGDLVINQSGLTNLTLTSTANTIVGGNFSATSNNTPIGQGTGNLTVANGVSTFTTNGNSAVTLNNSGNDFNTVVLNVGTGAGGSVNLRDANNITLGSTTASTVGDALTVNATGNITTGGVVNTVGVANLTAGGNVTFANGSSAGSLIATATTGNIVANTTANLTTGALQTSGSGSTISLTSTGVVTINGTAVTNGGAIGVTGQSINAGSAGVLTAVGSSVALTATGGNIVTPAVNAGGLALTTSGGSVSQFGNSIVNLTLTGGTGVTTLTSNLGTGSVNLPNANILSTTTVNSTASSVTVNAVGTNNAVNSNITLGDTNLTGNLTVTTNGSSAAGFGTVLIGTGFGTVSSNFNVGGSLNISTNASSVTDNPYVTEIVFGNITVNTTVANNTTGNAVSINAAGTNPDGLSVGRFGQWNINAGNSAINIAEGQTMNLGNITGNGMTFRTVSGATSDILINGQITGTGNASVTFNSNSGGSVLEGTSGNISVWANNTAQSAVTFNLSGSGRLDLPNVSNAFNNATVTLQNGSSLNIVSGTSIKVVTNNVTGGNTSVSTVGTSASINNTFGNTIYFGNSGTSNASNVTLNSSGDVVLGGSTLSVARLTVVASGNISNGSGGFSQMNNTLTLTAGGNVSLNQVSNNLTGNVVLANVVGDSLIYSARNLTISGNSTGVVTAVAGTAVAGTSSNTFSGPWNLFLGNLNVKGLNAGASNGNTAIAPLSSNPAVLVSAGSNYTITNNTNTGNLNLSFSGGGGQGATGFAHITNGVVDSVTITNPGAGYLSAPTISVVNGNTSTTPVNAVITSPAITGYYHGNLAGSNTSAGVGGNITQLAGTSLHVENTADFVTQNATINLANNGNSFGRVQASTGAFTGGAGSSAITIVEDSTLKVGNIATTGITTLTSRFGSIIDDPAANNIIGKGGAFVLNAPTGSVNLNSTHTAGTTVGDIIGANITAPSGSASIFSNNTITLGAVNVNSLSVVSSNAIIQSAPLKVFGPATFNATDNITLTDAGNNFGPVSVITTGLNKSVAVTENGTLNLRKVSMVGSGNGTFTATSVNGDIIDTGLGGVVAGGSITTNAVATTVTTGSGIVSLTATNGNIVIDDPTSDFPTTGGVMFNAKNVTLSVLGQGGYTLGLGSSTGSSVASNLTVSSALGDIGNLGNIVVSGDASFQTGTKNITLDKSGNSFGTLRFVGTQVQILQTGDMKIVTGSQAIGQALLTTNSGSISIVPRGGIVTFGNNVSLSASGNITLPKLVTVVGNLTVNAAGTKDLSALSISNDLSGKTPSNNGSGEYKAPQP